jgi:hypothetical protein
MGNVSRQAAFVAFCRFFSVLKKGALTCTPPETSFVDDPRIRINFTALQVE